MIPLQFQNLELNSGSKDKRKNTLYEKKNPNIIGNLKFTTARKSSFGFF